MREVAHVDITTQGMYQGYIERTIRPALGEYEVGYLEHHPSCSTACTPSLAAVSPVYLMRHMMYL